MKKLFLTLAVACFAAGVFAQTNGYKISAYSPATTPLTGNEVTILNQSGTTKSATIAQINYTPVSLNTGTSNYFWTAVANEIAARVAASNALWTANGTTATAGTTASNALWFALGAEQTNRATASNALWTANAATATTGNVASNSIQAQVTTLSNTVAGQVATVAAAVTNNGNATINSATISKTYSPATTFAGVTSANFFVDFSGADYQTIVFAPTSNGQTFNLIPTNLVNGRTITVLMQATPNGPSPVYVNPIGSPAWTGAGSAFSLSRYSVTSQSGWNSTGYTNYAYVFQTLGNKLFVSAPFAGAF